MALMTKLIRRLLRSFDMSKNAFKRAVGRLLKQGKVIITEDSIIINEKNK